MCLKYYQSVKTIIDLLCFIVWRKCSNLGCQNWKMSQNPTSSFRPCDSCKFENVAVESLRFPGFPKVSWAPNLLRASIWEIVKNWARPYQIWGECKALEVFSTLLSTVLFVVWNSHVIGPPDISLPQAVRILSAALNLTAINYY